MVVFRRHLKIGHTGFLDAHIRVKKKEKRIVPSDLFACFC